MTEVKQPVPHTLEPEGSPNQVFDAAFIALVLALLVAMTLGRSLDSAGAIVWDPAPWRFVHDAAKAMLMPLLLVRTYVATGGLGAKGLSARGVGFWVSWAMLLCWVGDLALTREGSNAFLVGLSAFLLGHIGYIMVFKRMAGARSIAPSKQGRRLPMLALLGAVVIGLEMLLWERAGEMAPAVLVYSLVIGAMTYSAWALDPGVKGVKLLAWGAVIFMCSDILIAMNKFYVPFAGAQQLVMITYAVAQWLIAQGIYTLMKR